MKTCTKCGKTKATNAFSKQGKYRRSRCKSCESDRVKEWQKSTGKYTHGIDKDKIIAMQDSKCAICQELLILSVVDHDHACCSGKYSCGKCVRGVLCRGCNLGLGNFKDSVINLERAIQYLQV